MVRRGAIWRLALAAVFIQALVTGSLEIADWLTERTALRHALENWSLPDDELTRSLQIRDHVREIVSFDGLDLNSPRPLLRATAGATLQSGRGFCGEGARLLIRLLDEDGTEARRLYLQRPDGTEHVTTEARVGGRWIVLDGQRGGLEEYERAAYIRQTGATGLSYWSPRLLTTIGLHPFARLEAASPAPALYTRLSESPQLIWAATAAAELSLVIAALRVFRRRRPDLAPRNADASTIEAFGYEWKKFDQSHLSQSELLRHFEQYFRVFPWDRAGPEAVGFDLGCGSGRWARFVAPRVGALHCIDASKDALDVARRNLARHPNCVFHHAIAAEMPIADGSMDFGYSLGVLHHIPRASEGIEACVQKLKPGGVLLVYLYYAFDNRPRWFRMLWRASDLARRVICRMPAPLRYGVSQVIAAVVYWPLARTALLAEEIGLGENFPLAYYRRSSFYVMRNDALDRFGTRVEHRFRADELIGMMEAAGLSDIRLSDQPPYWCAVGFRS